MNRRTFLAQTGLAAGSIFAAPLLSRASDAKRSSTLRVAQITDTHLFDKIHCPEKMQACIETLAAIRPAPDLILHTGDVVMDAYGTPDRTPVDRQWDLWSHFSKELPAAPVRSILGNHDIWLGESRSDPLFGKRLAMEQLGLPSPYYVFEQGGWTFLMLDSIRPPGTEENATYTARLDDVQREWLADQIRKIPADHPLIVCTHAPILSAAIFSMVDFKGGNWAVGSGSVLTDSHEIQAVLREHKGVTLCLSGHLHVNDYVVYDNIHYLGAGAACADWWKNQVYHETASGFVIYDLHPDGDWSRKYHPCAWTV